MNAGKQYNTPMYVNIVHILYWRCLQPTLLSHLWNKTWEEGGGEATMRGGGDMQWGAGGMFACSYIHCTCTQVLTVPRFWMHKQSVFDVECGNGGRYCASFQRVTYKDGNTFSRTFKGTVHCKKRLAIFPSPAGTSLTKLSLAGNNLIISRQAEFSKWLPGWERVFTVYIRFLYLTTCYICPLLWKMFCSNCRNFSKQVI